jgi:hypothetical protein
MNLKPEKEIKNELQERNVVTTSAITHACARESFNRIGAQISLHRASDVPNTAEYG